jgi:thioredoxin reductase (NADPH)
MSHETSARVVIIGGGPAGYTAALYTARARLEPVCIEGYESGGQIARSGRVDNFPGFPGGISGSDLGERIRQQASDFGAVFRSEDVTSVDFAGPRLRVVSTEARYDADAVIVASGARARRLGLESEDEFDGRGVCYCAICDGPFFADQRVVVVGGGDAAVEEALALSGIASSVVLVHRRREFRANATLRAALSENPNIRVITPSVVTEVLGGDLGVTGVRLRDMETGAETTLDTEGVFVAIGHIPVSGMFTDWLDADENGFLRATGEGTATRVPGVFVAGDVADPRYRQAVTAAASGCAAAIDAERWLMEHRGRQIIAARTANRDLASRNIRVTEEHPSADMNVRSGS